MWTYCVDDFGTNGAAIQSAIDLAYTKGGGVVMLSPYKRYVCDQDITVKSGVTLRSEFPPTPFGNIFTRGGVIELNSANTINLQSGAMLQGFGICRKGLTNSTDASFDAHCAGIAVSAIAGGPGVLSDIVCDNLFIIGFSTAIKFDYVGRAFLSRIVGDNKNGIYMRNSLDTSHISHCHFWPFGTTGTAGGAINNRTGVGFQMIGTHDWGDITNSFAYGYLTGFQVSNVHTFDLINCGADNNGLQPGSIGFQIITPTANTLTNCKSAANETGFKISAAVDLVSLIGCRSWANTQRGIYVDASKCNMSGCDVFDNTTYGVDAINASTCFYTYGDFHGNGANTHTAGGSTITVV